MFYDCRYISPCDFAWRIFSFDIHYRKPSVEHLSFHLPGEQIVLFEDEATVENTIEKANVRESMFIAWFNTNMTDDEARELTYNEFPSKFVWKRRIKKWEPRKSHQVIGRLFFVPPSSGELYYLRMLLNIVRGPKSYEELRSYNDVLYPSFRDACYARGLLNDDKEYVDAIKEASHWGSGYFLRKLFATLLWSKSMGKPEIVWEKCNILLSDGILHYLRTMFNLPDLDLQPHQILQFTLIEIEDILNRNGKSLQDFPTMPFPSLHVVDADVGKLFFLYGYGGTGKTFLWRTIAAAIRSRGEVVLTVASSDIASLLLPGGRTAHSRFAIPLTPDECSTCNIKQGSPLVELIIMSKLIIWDEAPMMNKFCFEALDRTMRDLLRFKNEESLNLPFGGKTVVLGGDFRQILPVVTKGSRQDIVHASINSAYLWNDCEILTLTQNMRLRASGDHESLADLKSFADWILNIGDGKISPAEDGFSLVTIPAELLITEYTDPIEVIVKEMYADYLREPSNTNFLQGRAILAPTLNVVEEINSYMLSLNMNKGRTYLSSDTASFTEGSDSTIASINTPEFLSIIKCSGLPNHELNLKEACPVMLMRNIDHSAGLCNGTRLIITRLGNKVIEAKVISGNNIGEKVFIPRLTLTPSDATLPVKFQRRQFPLMLSYAMIINKSQGQSLDHVGILLKQPVFTHGQLYVAISRVTNKKGLRIVISHEESENSTATPNVVYHEVFRNI